MTDNNGREESWKHLSHPWVNRCSFSGWAHAGRIYSRLICFFNFMRLFYLYRNKLKSKQILVICCYDFSLIYMYNLGLVSISSLDKVKWTTLIKHFHGTPKCLSMASHSHVHLIHQWRAAAMQGAVSPIGSNWGFRVPVAHGHMDS